LVNQVPIKVKAILIGMTIAALVGEIKLFFKAENFIDLGLSIIGIILTILFIILIIMV